jgi:hypothetical protein
MMPNKSEQFTNIEAKLSGEQVKKKVIMILSISPWEKSLLVMKAKEKRG